MATGTRLQLRLGQKLKMAPQLRQAIELLQLNRVELRNHIHDILESNPLLEREADLEFEDQAEGGETESEDSDFERDDFDDDYGWDDLPEGFSAVGDAPDYDAFIGDRSQESLQQHLLWQANLAGFSERDEAIARAIIYALDEDGYLHDDVDSLRGSLAPEYLVSGEEVGAVLERIQHFEPVGVAARSLRECLLVQVRARPADTPWRGLAEHIIDRHLELLGKQDPDRLARVTGFDRKAVDAAVALIRRLDPRPGSRFGSDDENYLVPDVYVHPHEGGWRITLNRDNDPGLKLNPAYSRLVRSSRGDDKKYLKDRLQEARWLISSLEMRNHTLRAVTQAIIERQSGFLERGEIAMQPLLQREIAERVEVHESTVSRATSGKYVHTPRGTFELKHFFSVAIPTADGGQASATAVKARIDKLIATEPPGKPYSDQALADALGHEGILLARRTVAKYRDQLGIPGSATRRRLGRMQPAAG